MITELRLRNFQGLQLNQQITLAPLTLIFGPNSGGKSALFRALKFIKQSYASQDALEYSSEDVDLWSFENTVFQHQQESDFAVGFTISRIDRIFGGPAFENVKIDYVIDKNGVSTIGLVMAVSPRKVRDESSEKAEITLAIIRDAESRNSKYKIAVLSITNFEILTEWANSAGPNIGMSFDEEMDQLDVDSLMNAMKDMKFDVIGFTPSPADDSQFRKASRAHRHSLRIFSRFIYPAFTGSREIFSRIQDVGPLRARPGALSADSRSRPKLLSDASNIDSILISASDVERKELSKWLRKLTDDAYTLEKEAYTSKNFGEIAQILLFDRRNKSVVRFSDVGVGLSQILPILVGLFIKTKKVGRGPIVRNQPVETLIVEQPELHLHPVMQAELGDLFVEQIMSAATRATQHIFVETHSENLLLRVKKLLREKRLSKDDVSIVYVNRFPGGGSLAQQIRIDNDGRLRDELPLDFVNLRAREIYGE